jgi:hypothetical protein
MFEEFYTVFADDVQFGPLAPTGQHSYPGCASTTFLDRAFLLRPLAFAAPHESPFGTDRRLRNVCVDGSYLGQTGPDMLKGDFLRMTRVGTAVELQTWDRPQADQSI